LQRLLQGDLNKPTRLPSPILVLKANGSSGLSLIAFSNLSSAATAFPRMPRDLRR
jgi:hypothetical protein